VFGANQARNRADCRELEPQGFLRRHDSWRPLAIAAHFGADGIPTGTASACWWRRTWLRAGFTYRTSHTSSITICLRWRRILSTALGERDATATRCGFNAFRERTAVRIFHLERSLASRSSACADETSSLPEKKDRNRSTCLPFRIVSLSPSSCGVRPGARAICASRRVFSRRHLEN